MYIVEYLSKYFIKQIQVKSNQNTSSCREWNVVLFVPELKVTGKPMIDGSKLLNWSKSFLCWRSLIFDVSDIRWMYQGHYDMFKMCRSLQSGRRFLWGWAWQIRGPWNVSVGERRMPCFCTSLKFPRSITRFNATEVIINATATLEDKNGKIHISKVDLLVRDEDCSC